MQRLVAVAHNIRSTHNVGSLLRTCDGLGVKKLYFTGYTPYPKAKNDSRLPHVSSKLDRQISKTALGAEKSAAWEHSDNILETINKLKEDGYTVAALEQTKNSQPLPDFTPPAKLVIILGREVEGIEPEVLEATDIALEIPMQGRKESYNVAVAAAIAIYHCSFTRS